jgi:MFS family permease
MSMPTEPAGGQPVAAQPPGQAVPWRGVFAGLCVVLLCAFTAFGAVVPVIPRLVVDRLQASAFAVGSAFAASGLVAIVARPFAGRLAQRLGSRPVMALGCLLASAVGALYAAPFGLPGLLGTRLIMGLAESMIFTAGAVWVVALAPVHRRGQLVGWYGLAMWSGWTLGPLLGKALFDAGGYPAVWAFAAAAPLAALAMLAWLPRGAAAGSAVSRRLVPRAAVLPGVSLALAAFGYAALSGFVVLLLADRGLGDGSALLSLFGATYIAVRLLAGRLPDRAGAARVAISCGLVEAAGLALVALAPAWWLAAVGALVMGGGFSLLYPALALLVINGSAEDERGAALGAYTSFWDLGLGIAGLVTGAVAAISYGTAFGLAAAMAVGSAAAGAVAARAVRGGHRAWA